MKKSLFKNMLYKITLNAFNLILPILVGPYVNRVLGAESIGKVQFVESIYAYFLIFATFGVYQYGLREISRIKDDKQKVSQLFTSLFTIGLVTSLAALLCYAGVSYFGYGDESIFPILMIFGFNFIANIFMVEWVNEAMENYDFITIKTVIVRIVYVILIFAMVNSSDNYIEYAMLLVLATVLNNIVSFIYIKRKIKFDFSNITIVEHLKPLFVVVVFANGNVLFTLLDRLMLGQFNNPRDVSFYVIPQQIMGIINTLMLSIIQVSLPRLSYVLGSNDEKSYHILLNNISKVYFSLLFPASAGIFVLSDVAVLIYGGQDFIGASTALSLFAFYMIVLGIDFILANQVIYVKKKENVLIKLVFISGFINVLFKVALLFMDKLTPATAVFTTAIATLILILLEYGYIKRYIKIDFKLFEWAKMKYLVYSLLFIPIAYFIRQYVSNPIPLFITIGITCSVIYGIILLVTKDIVVQIALEKVKGRFGKKQ
ncbi:oligosaccharide flippase family protein [Niallia oryzisoli]|uniref:oligosaccharide flippase family protein n=1 Tax=Niallia oryzisoli TaxID=1737571 RepID=UPI00373532E3